METSKRIIISGYYGFGNLGDEAILEALVRTLRDRFPPEKLEITVLSNKPEETRKNHAVSAIERSHLLGLIGGLKRTDLLISGGGGLFQDKTSSFSLWYYLGVILLARVFGKPVYVVGQGIGPIEKKFNKLLVSKTFATIDGFFVRDQQSGDLVTSYGVEKRKVLIGKDLAFLLNGKERTERKEPFSSEKSIVAAALRDEVTEREEIIESVSAGLEMLEQKHGADIVLFSTDSAADRPIIEQIKSRTDAGCNILDVDHLTTLQLIEMMKDLDFLIAGRLHVMIFSFLSCTPFQGISYDPKMDNFIYEVNQLEPAEKFSLWQPREVSRKDKYLSDLENQYLNRKKTKESISGINAKLVSQAQKGLDETLDWIEEELENG